MSIRSLYIGYSRVDYTTEQVKNNIDAFFKDNLVSGVDERLRKDKENKPFKIFFVHFSKVNIALQNFFDKLGKVESLRIYPWTLKFNTRHHLKNETSFLNERDDKYWTDLSCEFTPFVPVKSSNI
jgi:hypothetical protein